MHDWWSKQHAAFSMLDGCSKQHVCCSTGVPVQTSQLVQTGQISGGHMPAPTLLHGGMGCTHLFHW
jgi:hypothetical protein